MELGRGGIKKTKKRCARCADRVTTRIVTDEGINPFTAHVRRVTAPQTPAHTRRNLPERLSRTVGIVLGVENGGGKNKQKRPFQRRRWKKKHKKKKTKREGGGWVHSFIPLASPTPSARSPDLARRDAEGDRSERLPGGGGKGLKSTGVCLFFAPAEDYRFDQLSRGNKEAGANILKIKVLTRYRRRRQRCT